MGHLFAWYANGLTTILQNYRLLIHRLEALFAVRETFKHITEPLFQDYTFGGRVLGIFFRLGRALLAGLLYLVLGLLYTLSALIWALLPILIAASLAGYLFGTTNPKDLRETTEVTNFLGE